MDYMNELHELCETISHEIADANEKIRAAGGKLSGGDYETIDKLTHSLKSIKGVMQMMEDEDGYSGRMPDDMGGSYRMYSRNGGSYRGSYARGRGRNARRDSMGRYSNNGGYSGDGDLVEQLNALMQDAPNETIKREMQRLVAKVEQM